MNEKVNVSNKDVNEKVSEAAQQAVEATVTEIPKFEVIEPVDAEDARVSFSKLKSTAGTDDCYGAFFKNGMKVQVSAKKGKNRAFLAVLSLSAPVSKAPVAEPAKAVEPAKPAIPEMKIVRKRDNTHPFGSHPPLRFYDVQVGFVTIYDIRVHSSFKADTAEPAVFLPGFKIELKDPEKIKANNGKTARYLSHVKLEEPYKGQLLDMIREDMKNDPPKSNPVPGQNSAGPTLKSPQPEPGEMVKLTGKTVQDALDGKDAQVLSVPINEFHADDGQVLRYADIGEYRFIQQSKTTQSKWANLLISGKHVTAVYHRIDSTKPHGRENGQWVCAIVDGIPQK